MDILAGILMAVIGTVIKLGILALLAREGKASRAARRELPQDRLAHKGPLARRTIGKLTIDPTR